MAVREMLSVGVDIGTSTTQIIECRKKSGSDRSLDQKATGYNELLIAPGDPLGDIVPELAPIEDEIVITKTTDSALTGTNLRLMLHNMGIDTVVVTGVLTDQCVSGTVRSLADESFKVWLIEDACRTISCLIFSLLKWSIGESPASVTV